MMPPPWPQPVKIYWSSYLPFLVIQSYSRMNQPGQTATTTTTRTTHQCCCQTFPSSSVHASDEFECVKVDAFTQNRSTISVGGYHIEWSPFPAKYKEDHRIKPSGGRYVPGLIKPSLVLVSSNPVSFVISCLHVQCQQKHLRKFPSHLQILSNFGSCPLNFAFYVPTHENTSTKKKYLYSSKACFIPLSDRRGIWNILTISNPFFHVDQTRQVEELIFK